ncbi:MAG: PAS domain S-box protein [Leptolyngbyaceae bacterium]|nr:PAS domain S-box protein [Leptolyngbyaceae bacterium]
MLNYQTAIAPTWREQKIAGAEKRFRALLEYATDMILILDAEGIFHYASPSVERILGYRLEDLIGRSIFEFSHPGDNAQLHQTLEQVAQVPGIRQKLADSRIRHQDGHWRVLEAVVTSFLDTPEVNGIVINCQDITPKKYLEREYNRTKDELWQATSKLRAIFQAFPHLYFCLDAEGTILEYEAGEAASFYASLEICVGKRIQDILPPPIGDQFQAAILQVQTTQLPATIEYSIPHHRHEQRFEARLLPLETSQIVIFLQDITERIQTRKRLDLLQSVVVHANDAVVVTEATPTADLGHKILYVNEAFTQMTGYSAEEAIGQSPRLLQGAKTDPVQMQKIRTALQNWQPIKAELINYRKDGSEFWVELSIVPVTDASGYCTHWISIEREITERKQVEAALRRANQQLGTKVETCTLEVQEAIQNLEGEILRRKQVEAALQVAHQRLTFHIENSPLAIIEWDRDFKVTRWSKAAERVFGWSAAEVIGKYFESWEFVFDDDKQGVKQIASRLVSGREQQNVSQNRNYTKDGSIVHCEWYTSALLDQEGNLVSLLSRVLDVTERKRIEDERQQAEVALRDSEERFRSLVEHTNDWVWECDRTGAFTYVNPGVHQILGYPIAKVLGKTPLNFMMSDEAARVRGALEPCLGQHRSFSNFESALLHQAGHQVILESSGSPIFDTQGVLQGYRGISRDITERKRVELEVRKALNQEKELSELKSRFVTMASHEFRTPLSTILLSSELLEHYNDKLSEEKKLQQLLKIQTSVKNMTQLLEDVLLIGKVESGKVTLNPVPLDLTRLCRDFIEDLQLLAGSKHTLNLSIQGLQQEVYLDEKLLRSILNNLISNAIKYSPRGGEVELTVTYRPQGICFHIQDQGIGIPEADQQRLFDSFHRATNVGSIPGTGLGLAIVKKAVELHGGQISVSSQVGVGTAFTVELPSHSPEGEDAVA